MNQKNLCSTLFLAILLLNNCTYPQKKCTYTVDEIISNERAKVFSLDQQDNNYKIVKDKGKDSIRGGYYSFSKSGNLKEYLFYSTKEVYSFREVYNDIGECIIAEGKPLVNYKLDRLNADSVNYTLYLYALKREYDSLKVKFMNSGEIYPLLVTDSLYSNMLITSFVGNIKGHDSLSIYISVIQKDICSGSTSKIEDTLTFFLRDNLIDSVYLSK